MANDSFIPEALQDGMLNQIPPDRLAQLQGELLQLFLASDRHGGMSLASFAQSILPPIHFNQFRIYRSRERAIGFVCWAMFSEADGKAFMAGDFDLTFESWVSGDQLWFIEFIAPFGHALEMAADLRDNVLPDQIAYAPDIDDDTGEKRVRVFRGKNRQAAQEQRAEMEEFLGRL